MSLGLFPSAGTKHKMDKGLGAGRDWMPELTLVGGGFWFASQVTTSKMSKDDGEPLQRDHRTRWQPWNFLVGTGAQTSSLTSTIESFSGLLGGVRVRPSPGRPYHVTSFIVGHQAHK